MGPASWPRRRPVRIGRLHRNTSPDGLDGHRPEAQARWPASFPREVRRAGRCADGRRFATRVLRGDMTQLRRSHGEDIFGFSHGYGDSPMPVVPNGQTGSNRMVPDRRGLVAGVVHLNAVAYGLIDVAPSFGSSWLLAAELDGGEHRRCPPDLDLPRPQTRREMWGHSATQRRVVAGPSDLDMRHAERTSQRIEHLRRGTPRFVVVLEAREIPLAQFGALCKCRERQPTLPSILAESRSELRGRLRLIRGGAPWLLGSFV